MVLLFLTCANKAEADTIATALLEKKLIACVNMIPATSQFFWQGSIDHVEEILLIMDSEESKFDQAEQEIRKLHSYKTFVLRALEVKKTSAGVKEWIKESLS